MKTYFYMLSLCLYGSSLMAQNPGGVAGPTLWIKADAGTSTSAGPLATWTYANDLTKVFTAVVPPTVVPNAINFKPAVSFDGTQFMAGPNLLNAPLAANDDDYSYFAVWMTNDLTPGFFQRVWSQRGSAVSNNGTALWIYNQAGLYGNQAEIAPYTHLIQAPATVNKWNISQINLLPEGTNDQEIFDSSNLASGTPILGTTGAPRQLSDELNLLGSRSAAIAEESLRGAVAEVIVYDHPITDPNERTRIFSYLAIKYGINLNINLLSSTGATVWNNALLTGFTNDVFGIGADAGSGLQSTTSNSLTTAGEINLTLSNPTDLQDGEFMLIGHDGGNSDEGNGEVPQEQGAPGTSKRINRKWLVQHTGDVGGVRLTFDVGNSNFSGNPTLLRNFVLVVDTDGDNDLSTGPRTYVFPSNLIGTQVIFDNVSLPTGAVLGLISAASDPLPVTWKSFNGTFKNAQVTLNWTVDNNEKGDRYEVEHSTDGKTYQVIGTIANKPDVKSYSFSTGNYANGANYYRVHQIDHDGQDIYSKVYTVTINSGADFSFKVASNPVKGNTLKLQVRSGTAVKATVEIWSLAGVQVLNRQQTIDAGSATINIPLNNVPAGSYVVKLKQNGIVRSAGIIKL